MSLHLMQPDDCRLLFCIACLFIKLIRLLGMALSGFAKVHTLELRHDYQEVLPADWFSYRRDVCEIEVINDCSAVLVQLALG